MTAVTWAASRQIRVRGSKGALPGRALEHDPPATLQPSLLRLRRLQYAPTTETLTLLYAFRVPLSDLSPSVYHPVFQTRLRVLSDLTRRRRFGRAFSPWPDKCRRSGFSFETMCDAVACGNRMYTLAVIVTVGVVVAAALDTGEVEAPPSSRSIGESPAGRSSCSCSCPVDLTTSKNASPVRILCTNLRVRLAAAFFRRTGRLFFSNPIRAHGHTSRY